MPKELHRLTQGVVSAINLAANSGDPRSVALALVALVAGLVHDDEEIPSVGEKGRGIVLMNNSFYQGIGNSLTKAVVEAEDAEICVGG